MINDMGMFLVLRISFVDCSIAVIIKVEEDAKEEHKSSAGRYERSNDFNGKPTYEMDNQKILFGGNHWSIGRLENGIHYGLINAFDEFGGLTDPKNVWKYWDRNAYGETAININANCASGTS